MFGFYCIGIPIFISLTTSDAQVICSRAPTEAIRIMCKQIKDWARISKNVRPQTKALVPSPGATGLFAESASRPAGAPSTSPTNAYECMDIACLCRLFGGTGGFNCVLANGQTLRKAVRKEYRVLTDDERQRYHRAMWTVKRNGEYDVLSRIHFEYMTSPGAHSGPAFLPWHRELLKRLEITLRRVDPTVALPYWDSTLDERLPDPRDSSLWSNELMGKQDTDSAVRNGAFRNWLTVDGRRVFRRSVGTFGNLMTENEISSVMAVTDVRQILAFTAPQRGCPYPANWTALEYIHGGPHIYTGGDMLVTLSSTNDPLFFSHHSMVDYIWEMWRVTKQSRSERETVYPRNNALCSSSAHFSNSVLAPFYPMVNLDGLSNRYTGTSSVISHTVVLIVPRKSSLVEDVVATQTVPTATTRPTILTTARPAILTTTRAAILTTSRPAILTTTTTATQVQETCFNEQQCCASWAEGGECGRNPPYMNLRCKASCRLCTPTTYDLKTECSNRHSGCVIRKNRGECQNNRAWMMENCREACGACTITRLQACIAGVTRPSTTTGRPTTTTTTTAIPAISDAGCLNQHYCCIAWASRGYCSAPDLQSYMVQYCQPSCEVCFGIPATTIWNTRACSNFHPSCTTWAAQGYCSTNRAYMWENCRQSCGACRIGTLSTRLLSCGFPRRLNFPHQPVPEFFIELQSSTFLRQTMFRTRKPLSMKRSPSTSSPRQIFLDRRSVHKRETSN